MMTWPEYFRRVRAVQKVAERAGIPKLRAAAIAHEAAAHPLPRKRAARLLALAAKGCSGRSRKGGVGN